MKKVLLILFFIILQENLIAQNIDTEKETLETIEWLNSKFVEFKYNTHEVEQVFLINDIREFDNELYLSGVKQQNTDNPLAAFKAIFGIPILKINSIRFEEKTNNYWAIISMKNEQESILLFNGEGDGNLIGKYKDIAIIMDKAIDNEKLRPRIIKAFNYLIELHGNNKIEEKF
ncbi:hypothetical protein [Gillisia marina]|uniref:hypothetical protein n=1 Tax=Gillisia marina TaxID=1167637 RepID=UPI00029A27F3|nr:hypothetical protein [Gillisia marina]